MILDHLAYVLLMPVLLMQALYARLRVIQLPEPDGPRSGSVGQGPVLRVLIIGDSSAAGVGVDTQAQALAGQLTQRLATVATVQYDVVAQTGAKTSEVRDWLDHMPGKTYDLAVIALGVNDVTKGVSLRRWLSAKTQLLDGLVQKFGVRRIVVSGLPPVGQFPLLPHPLRWLLGRRARMFDHHLRDLIRDRPECIGIRIKVALDQGNMSPDGFHPGPGVYADWAEQISTRVLDDTALLDPALTTA